MDDIKQEVEELIYAYITNTKTKVNCPNDILEELTYDAVEDIKERIWELIKYEIDYRSIFDEIEKSDYCDTESDLDEEELRTDDESDEE